MKNQLIELITNHLQQMQWPSTKTPTSKNSEDTYYMGLDTVETYRGNPQDLIGALSIFISTNVLSYSLAGSAVVLQSASYIQGDTYDLDGIQKAFDLLISAQKLFPNRPEIDWLEPSLLICKKDFQSARKILDQLQKKHSSHFLISSVEMRYWSQFNITAAEKWFRDAIESPISNRRRINLLNAMAGNYLRGQLPDKALDLYIQITDMDQQDPWLWHNMSIIYLNKTQYAEAYECNKRALSLMDFGAAREVSEIIIRNINKELQIKEAKESIEQGSKHTEILLWKMVDGYIATRQFGEAIQTLTRIIKFNPKDASAYNHRGNLFEMLGQFDNAIADFSMAIKYSPKSAQYYYNRGNSYYTKREPKRAIDDFSYALKLQPQYFEAFLNRGNCYKALRQYPKAINDYNEALKIQTKAVLPHINLGISYAEMGNRTKAKEEFEAILVMTDNPQIREDIQRRLGRL